METAKQKLMKKEKTQPKMPNIKIKGDGMGKDKQKIKMPSKKK